MIVSGEELIKRLVKALDEISRREGYIKLQDAHCYVDELCGAWDCEVCTFNDQDIGCKMADFLDGLPKHEPVMKTLPKYEAGRMTKEQAIKNLEAIIKIGEANDFNFGKETGQRIKQLLEILSGRGEE